MPKYRVKVGAVLPHDGRLQPSGTVVELPAHVAMDPVVACLVEPLEPVVVVEPEPPADQAAYRVRVGYQLPHGGTIIGPGGIVLLTRQVATDTDVAYRVEPVIESFESVLDLLADDPLADEE